MLSPLKLNWAQQAKGGLFPIWGVSAVSAAQNTPILKRMFRQRPDHISARCSPQPVSCGRIPGAAFHRWPVWGWGLAREALYGKGPRQAAWTTTLWIRWLICLSVADGQTRKFSSKTHLTTAMWGETNLDELFCLTGQFLYRLSFFSYLVGKENVCTVPSISPVQSFLQCLSSKTAWIWY